MATLNVTSLKEVRKVREVITEEDMEVARELLFFSKMCEYSISQLENRSEFMRVDYMEFKSQLHEHDNVTKATSYPCADQNQNQNTLALPQPFAQQPEPCAFATQPIIAFATQPTIAFATQPTTTTQREYVMQSVVSQNLRKISFADFYYCKREYSELFMHNRKRDSKKLSTLHNELCALALCGASRTEGSERDKLFKEDNDLV